MGIIEYFVKRTRRKSTGCNVIFLGLDGAGKSSLLNFLSGESNTTVSPPTQGFLIKNLKIGNFKVHAFDVGGQDHVRPYWRQYYSGAGGIVFVIDASDYERLQEAYDVLQEILEEDKLRGTPVLIFANKQDLMDRASTETIKNALDLEQYEIGDRPLRWRIQSCSAVTGVGVLEGLEWLLQVMH